VCKILIISFPKTKNLYEVFPSHTISGSVSDLVPGLSYDFFLPLVLLISTRLSVYLILGHLVDSSPKLVVLLHWAVSKYGPAIPTTYVISII
jgi:hypothetical protein